MAFKIPNAAAAEDPSQAMVDSGDFDVLVAAFAGTGVVSGCAVTAQGTPDMTLAVAAGTVAVAGTSVAVTGGNVTITAANATNPRFDLVVVNNTGVKSVTAGTPAAQPVFPAIPANSVVLASVRVPAGAGSINSQKIWDRRVAPVITPPAFSSGMMMPFAGTAAPGGWLLCDGSAVSRTTYSTLFALIGTAYGAGDGSTTFNVPDLRGRSCVGYAASGGHADVSAVGNNEGSAAANRRPKHPHSNTLSASHNHTLPDHGHVNTLSLPNHAHSDTISFSDTGHVHGQYGSAVGYVFTGGGGRTSAMVAGMDAGVGAQIGGDYNTGGPSTVGFNKSGGVGNPTSNPGMNGSVGSASSFPAIPGTVTISGQVGVIGTANDTPAYLVVNYIIKT